jgi:hypothetical protein
MPTPESTPVTDAAQEAVRASSAAAGGSASLERAGGAGSATSTDDKKSKKRQRIADPDRIEDFVDYAYKRRGQRVVLKKKSAVAIAEAPAPGSDFWEHLAKMADEDRTLAVPKQVLLAGIPHKASVKTWSLLLDVCLIALRAHPASSEWASSLAAVTPEFEQGEQLLSRAAATDVSRMETPDGKKLFTPAQAAAVRSNLVAFFAVWMVAVRGWSSSRCIRAMHEQVWVESGSGLSVADTWRRLTEVRDPTSLGLAAGAFVQEAKDRAQEAELARRAESVALHRIEELASQVSALKGQVHQQEERHAALLRQLDDARQQHQTAVSHLRDDYERLRSKILRRLTRELELLDEGMLAIKREPPKVHVMVDHGERAMGGLRDEIKSLQAEVRE